MSELSDEDSFRAFYPSPNTVCTRAYSQFLTEYHANIDYFLFVLQLVARVDANRVTAAKALLTGERDAAKRRDLERSASDTDATVRELRKHGSVLSQTLTNGSVNAFQRYFSFAIQDVARKRPEVLKSQQKIQIDEILEFSRKRDLVAFIIDKKVNELSYGGLAAMERYFSDSFGVEMFQDDRERELLRLFIEARNINVHNGGIVNSVFAERVKSVAGFPYSVGTEFRLDFDKLVILTGNAMSVTAKIDEAIGRKFKLRRRRHSAWRDAR